MNTQQDNTPRSWQADPISVPPTIETERARIWLVDLAKFAVAKQLAGVALWLIEAPWAHPLWHSYILSLVNLKSGDGIPAPVLYLDGATHEMVLVALDPDQPRQPIFEEMAFDALAPANFAAQMIMPSDEAAIDKVAAAVAMIAKGELSPDTDFLQQWVGLFGDSMLLNRTTKH